MFVQFIEWINKATSGVHQPRIGPSSPSLYPWVGPVLRQGNDVPREHVWVSGSDLGTSVCVSGLDV